MYVMFSGYMNTGRRMAGTEMRGVEQENNVTPEAPPGRTACSHAYRVAWPWVWQTGGNVQDNVWCEWYMLLSLFKCPHTSITHNIVRRCVHFHHL